MGVEPTASVIVNGTAGVRGFVFNDGTVTFSGPTATYTPDAPSVVGWISGEYAGVVGNIPAPADYPLGTLAFDTVLHGVYERSTSLGSPAWAGPVTNLRGANGAPGPNEVTTSTTTNLTGILKGDGANVGTVTIGSGLSYSAGTLSATGGGGGAPTDASYVTLGTNGTLSAERVLTAGTAITLTDGGAGSTITVGVTANTYQPLDATLTAFAALTIAANSLTVGTGADAFSQTSFAANTFPARASTGDLAAKTITDFGLSLVDDADASAARTTLGLVIGTDVQAYDAELAAIAGLTSAADKLPYFTGSGTAALADFTAAGRAILDDADAAAQRTTLGLAAVASSGSASDLSTGTLPSGRLPAFTGGDVTSSAGSAVSTIANDAVTYAKLQNVSATSRILGRKTSGAGDTEECTLSEILDFVGSAAQGDILYRGASGWARLGAGTSGHYLQTQGASANPQWAAVAGGSGTVDVSVQHFRLTTESGAGVSTSDRTSQSTIYLTPFVGNQIAVYSGSAWSILSSAEVSLALSGLTSGKNYDVFAYSNSGTLTLELSAAWTNDTTRADALTTQDGVYVKSGATTRRYVGTIRTTGTTTTEDSGGGSTTQVGGKRFVWNLYHRVELPLNVFDSTNSWTHASTWRQANGATGNKVEWLVGLNLDPVEVDVLGECVLTANTQALCGVGIDSTTAASGVRTSEYNSSGSPNTAGALPAKYRGRPGIGYHYAAWLEASITGTITFLGDNGSVLQTGLSATVRG